MYSRLPRDVDLKKIKIAKSHDDMLYQALTEIFCGCCFTTNGQTKKLLPILDLPIIQQVLLRKPGLGNLSFPSNDLSLLWIAILRNWQNSAELLVRLGADVNRRRHTYVQGISILHYLIMQYPSSWIEQFFSLVIDHGADPNVRFLNESALECSIKQHRFKLTKLLIESGADFTTVLKDSQRQNLLHRLIFWEMSPQERVDLAKFLIEKGVSLDDKEITDLRQPIHSAIEANQNELVKLFLDHGADVNAKTSSGKFPLFLASEDTDKDLSVVLSTLLKRGANIDMTHNGKTALHAACTNRNLQIMKILLSAGADMLVEDNEGQTPFALIYPRYYPYELYCHDKCMIKAMVLKKVSSQSTIKFKDEEIIEKDPQMLDYYRECIEAVRDIKTTSLFDKCTFFDLLTKCQCRIAALMRNREFEKKFRHHNLSVFSHYAEDIRKAFEHAKDYHQSVLEQEDLIVEAVYNVLPYEIVRKVARYTVDCEFRQICPCFL